MARVVVIMNSHATKFKVMHQKTRHGEASRSSMRQQFHFIRIGKARIGSHEPGQKQPPCPEFAYLLLLIV